jgi:hypothetical protein
MTPSDFAKADVEDVLNNLTTEEVILLTAGVGFWHTHAVGRLGVPAIKVSQKIVFVLSNLNGFRSATAQMALGEIISSWEPRRNAFP